jgi:hypothetical protein
VVLSTICKGRATEALRKFFGVSKKVWVELTLGTEEKFNAMLPDSEVCELRRVACIVLSADVLRTEADTVEF